MGIAFDSIKKGFDWINLKKFYVPFAIIFILVFIPLIGFILSSVAIAIWLFPMIIDHYGLKSRYLNNKKGAFVAAIKLWFFESIATLLNWRQRNILYMQVGSFLGAVIIFIAAVLMQDSPIKSLMFLVGFLLFAVDIVLVCYNGLRYSQARMFFFSTVQDAVDALDMSWKLTEGRMMSMVGFYALLMILGLVILIVVGILSIVLLFVPVLGSLLSTVLVLAFTVAMSFIGDFALVSLFIKFGGPKAPSPAKKARKK